MKVAIYYNHYNTLGHSTRMLALIRAIKKEIPKSRIVLFEGGRTSDVLPLKRYAKIYTLPFSMDKKGLFIEEKRSTYEQMIRTAGVGAMLQKRIGLMRKVLSQFKPDIFITEYFPFGQEFWTFEMEHLLGYVQRELKCKIVGSCGYLSYTSRTREAIKQHYDRIFIHTPRGIATEHVRYFAKPLADGLIRTLKDFKDKITFTGFVMDEPNVRGADKIRDTIRRKGYSRFVFVSRGGGIVNKEIIIAALLLAQKRTDHSFVVCCGPATSDKDMRQYEKLAARVPNAQLVHALKPDVFDRYLAAADVCISMSGYNTAAKLMRLAKRAVLVPYGTTEQLWRAKSLGQFIPSVVLEEKHINVDRLGSAIEQVLKDKIDRQNIPALWFQGASETVRMLKCL